MSTLGDTYGVTEPVQVDPSQILAVGKSEIVYVNEMGEQTSVPISHDQSIRMTRFGGYQSIEQANIAITKNNQRIEAQQQYEANRTNEIDEPESAVENNTSSIPPYTLTEAQKAGLESGNYEVIKETYSTNRAVPIDRYWYTNVEDVDPDTTQLENELSGEQQYYSQEYIPEQKYYSEVEENKLIQEAEGGYNQWNKAIKGAQKSQQIQSEVTPYKKTVAKSQQIQSEVTPYMKPPSRYEEMREYLPGAISPWTDNFSQTYFQKVAAPIEEKYLSQEALDSVLPAQSGGYKSAQVTQGGRFVAGIGQSVAQGALYVPLLPALGIGIAKSGVGLGKLATDTALFDLKHRGVEDDIREFEGKEFGSFELAKKGGAAAGKVFSDFGTALYTDPGRTLGTVAGAVFGYAAVTKVLKVGGKSTLGRYSDHGGTIGKASTVAGDAPSKLWHIVSQPHELIVDGIIGRGLKGTRAGALFQKGGGSIFPEEILANMMIKSGGALKSTSKRRGRTRVLRVETGKESAFSNEAIQKKIDMEKAFSEMNIRQSKIRGEAEVDARIKFEAARDSGQEGIWTTEYPEMIWGRKNPEVTKAYQDSIIDQAMSDVDAKVDVTKKIYTHEGTLIRGESMFGRKGKKTTTKGESTTRVEQGLYDISPDSKGYNEVFNPSDTDVNTRFVITTETGKSDDGGKKGESTKVDVTNRNGKKKPSKIPILAALGLAGAGAVLGDKKKSAQGGSRQRYDFSGGYDWSKELKFEIADFDFKDLDTKKKPKKGEFDFDFDFSDVIGGKGSKNKSMKFNDILSTGKGKNALDWRKII